MWKVSVGIRVSIHRPCIVETKIPAGCSLAVLWEGRVVGDSRRPRLVQVEPSWLGRRVSHCIEEVLRVPEVQVVSAEKASRALAVAERWYRHWVAVMEWLLSCK